MKVALLAGLVLTLSGNACTDLWKDQSKQTANSKQQETPCAARYVPVGNSPEIALDTQTGTLCRTISDTNDPLGVREPACAVSAQYKKLGFVPEACKSGQTWVRGEGDKNSSSYASLPACTEMINGKKKRVIDLTK